MDTTKTIADFVLFFFDLHSSVGGDRIFRTTHANKIREDDGDTAIIDFEGQKKWKKFDEYLDDAKNKTVKILIVRDKQGFSRTGIVTNTSVKNRRTNNRPPSSTFNVHWVKDKFLFCKKPDRPSRKPVQFKTKRDLLAHLKLHPMTTTNSGIIPCTMTV